MRILTVFILLFTLVGLGASGIYLVGLHHFRAAQDAWDRQALEEAQAELEQCLRVWPWSYRGHLLAARTARRLHAGETALQCLAACERLEGSTNAVALESVLLEVQQGRMRRTEDMLHKLLADKSPEAPLILEALAEGYVKTFQSQKALEAVTELLQRQPANHAALSLRGTVYGFLRKDEDALHDFERAVELRPSADEFRSHLAFALLKLGRIREARAQYEWLRQRQPDNVSVALGLARCQHDLGELDQARQLLDSVLSVQPKFVAVLVERSRVAIRQAELEAAETWLRAAVKLAPFDRDANALLYACLREQHKREEADQVLSVVKKLETENARLETLMTKVLDTPRDLNLHCEIGLALLRNGRDEEGLRWLQRVLQQDPGNARALAVLAEYERRKENAGAPVDGSS
ncbi:MAG TPA: tetratricopeptide repeat protein [Gemmataceae bacterium]|jgi:tetratricopeptide (TPR) repeat protein|nr:tetratricopeptide repeat protein [Gemmataceae bacterium]